MDKCLLFEEGNFGLIAFKTSSQVLYLLGLTLTRIPRNLKGIISREKVRNTEAPYRAFSSTLTPISKKKLNQSPARKFEKLPWDAIDYSPLSQKINVSSANCKMEMDKFSLTEKSLNILPSSSFRNKPAKPSTVMMKRNGGRGLLALDPALPEIHLSGCH